MLNTDDFRAQARSHLPRFVFDYVEGGAEDEDCLRRNRSDLLAQQLVPTCLRDTSNVDMSLQVFGQKWVAPIGVAPVGLSGLVRPGGDIQLARAATAAGVPFILSTASNSRLEDVRANAPDGNLWMQLYVMSDRKIAEQLVRRAVAARYSALVLTVDVPVSGMRERDVRNGFKLPMKITPKLILDLVSRPSWSLQMLIKGTPNFVNLSETNDAATSPQLQAALLSRSMDRKMVWESLQWLRKLWPGPLLVKGILNPTDAQRAVQHGADGLIVSNHGGRQLDVAPSSISALPQVVDVVAGRIPVFVDSGFRRGSDVVKALAHGATAAFLGRAPLWGLGAAGEKGVNQVLQLVTQEMERTMVLLGAASLEDIGPHHHFKSIEKRAAACLT